MPSGISVAAGAITVVWISLAVARLEFSSQLPELDQVFDRSATVGGLYIAVGVTVVASLLPKRSAKRSLTAYAVAMACVTLSLARDYWDERRSYTPARLAAARTERVNEIVLEREADQTSEETLKVLRNQSKPAGSASGPTK